ncbi:MAG: exosortase H [Planctomycetes bacterium]|nr:exosortase H [Planctomycetota bacterium]
MRKSWKAFFQRHWVLARFGPLFLFLIALFFLLVGHRFFSEIVPIERYFTQAVAEIASIGLNGIGMDAAAEGTLIMSRDPDAPIPDYSVDLRTGCNGLVATLIFIAAIIAFPATIKHKAWGILLGVLAIQCFNICRIGVLFYLGLYHKNLFETVHVYVAQSILIAVAAALWLLWSIRAGRQPGLDGP